MNKKIWIALIVVLVVAVSVYIYVFHKPARTAASEKAKYSLTASELVSDFEKNENSANEKYLNKIVKINGVVTNVTENQNEISVSLEGDGMSGINCSFSKETLDKTKIAKGDKVFIKGICTGFLMDVVLNKCALVSQDTE